MTEPFRCRWCSERHPHHHQTTHAPSGREIDVLVMHHDRHPRAEVRDSESGEVLFPAVKGPLTLIDGGPSTTSNPDSEPSGGAG